MKDTQIRKEQVKLLLLPGDIILYIGNPKDSTKILPQNKKQTKKPPQTKTVRTNNKCSKVAGYKINTQK